MKFHRALKSSSGMVLSELMVALVIFLLFSGSLLAIVTLGMRYWGKANANVLAQQNARLAAEAIVSEMKQAIPNPDPGGVGRTPTGYLAITPALEPTGVLYPNYNQPSLDYVEFTEPNPVNYDRASSGFVPEDPSNYQRIRYYVSGKKLYRDITRYDSNGISLGTSTSPLAAASGEGTLSMEVDCLAARLFRITIRATEKGKSFQYSSQIFIASE